MVLSYTIPDDIYAELLEVYGKNYKEVLVDPKTKEETPNPQTKDQYVKKAIKTRIMQLVNEKRQADQREAARQQAKLYMVNNPVQEVL